MRAKLVTSTANPLVKELAALKTRRGREDSGTFLVEGAREVTAAVKSGRVQALRLLFAPELMADRSVLDQLIAGGGDAPLFELSAAAFGRLSLRQNPDGLALQANVPRVPLADLGLASASLVLVIDGVEKPGNLGALLRSADATGVDAVVVTGGGTDLYNPNVVRASQGSLFAVPVAVSTATELAAAARAAGLALVVATPAAATVYWDADLNRRVAIVLGAEDRGVGQELSAAADASVRIPMRAALADSLNVSVAGALLLFEALRQRSASRPAG